MRAFAILALVGAIPAGAAEPPDGDPDTGRQLASQCRTCHGLEGYAQIPAAPHIGGEPASYLASQLTAFREGERQNEMMSVVAGQLSDQQIADLAAWYAAQKPTATLTADPAGAPDQCVECHGADGMAVIEDAPNLAGEPNVYLESQLKAFRSGDRQHEVMNEIASDLSDSQIRAAADWYGATTLKIEAPK